MLHMSRQLDCRHMCKIMTWLNNFDTKFIGLWAHKPVADESQVSNPEGWGGVALTASWGGRHLISSVSLLFGSRFVHAYNKEIHVPYVFPLCDSTDWSAASLYMYNAG